jgi:S1-C subfamily serine protease
VVGDVIVNVRGTKIEDAADVLTALATVDTDQRVSVKILRAHKPLTIDVKLASSASSALEWPQMNWLKELFEKSGIEPKSS